MDEIEEMLDDRGFENISSLNVYIEEPPLMFVLALVPEAQVWSVITDIRSKE